MLQPLRKRHHRGGVQVQKSQIGERRRQPLRVQEFRFLGAFAIHRFAAVQQDAHGNMLLGLVDLQEELSQPEIGAPIERTRIITEAVPAVIGEFHPRAMRAGAVLGAHSAGQVAAAQQCDLFERLQKFAVE